MRQKGFTYFWVFSYGWWRKYGWFVCSQQIITVSNTLWSRTLATGPDFSWTGSFAMMKRGGTAKARCSQIASMHTKSSNRKRGFLRCRWLDKNSSWLIVKNQNTWQSRKRKLKFKWWEDGRTGYRQNPKQQNHEELSTWCTSEFVGETNKHLLRLKRRDIGKCKKKSPDILKYQFKC